VIKRSGRIAVVMVGLLSAASAAWAQQGTIAGTVRDQRAGLPLAGAAVSVIGSAHNVVTDANGRFLLLNVPSGEQRLAVEYLGYGETTRRVTVLDGGTVSVVFALEVQAVRGDEILVTGTRQGQARALQQQRSAVNVTNIVAADQIGRFPDANIGDALKRIPGVT
jgi:hypothetical protein